MPDTSKLPAGPGAADGPKTRLRPRRGLSVCILQHSFENTESSAYKFAGALPCLQSSLSKAVARRTSIKLTAKTGSKAVSWPTSIKQTAKTS